MKDGGKYETAAVSKVNLWLKLKRQYRADSLSFGTTPAIY
jgi:hypothetical protein